MTSQPHLQPINSRQFAHHHEASTFPLFTILPKELRTKIWRYALRRQRIIRLHINNQRGKTASEAGETPDSVANGELYFTVVDGSQLLSKFLRVGKESREEALKFHRVHLPCRFTGGTTKEGPASHGTLHFNPEWDILYISAEWPAKDILIAFLHRLKTIHDPRRVGLLNLAIDGNGLNGNDIIGVQPSEVESETRSAFVETLTQLRQVWFVSTPVVGRQIVGPLSGFGIAGAMFNRAFPILSTLPTFERLPRDPRSISNDLENTSGLGSSRNDLQYWLRLLKKWQISPQKNVTYRFFLAFDPRIARGNISDQVSAQAWLQKQEDQWNGQGPGDGFLPKDVQAKWPVGAQDEMYRNEDLENAVRPAFGFWLFPLEALGRIGQDGLLVDEETRPRGEMFRDMTTHWPELGLSSLP
ncbi:hypothetical protein IMSHALPRED_010329 [Imshaugia aleurites]|uniref:2EXR domain-containing protein n=1 Tax=Imshaugia aleurites TaxID=172621 RepID=A0A8H3G4Q4_9LECA|nr:hypothetical protein IMSHALPRED_010329 [Imshaugia aleurites]